MRKITKKIFLVLCAVLLIIVNLNYSYLYAEEYETNADIGFYSIGDSGESIKVKGLEATVNDYAEVDGYEATSIYGDYHIWYRDYAHHCMEVSTAEGLTYGYCMQPYMKGPGMTAFVDYNYVENLDNSAMFSVLSAEEKEKWKAVYMVATKYGFGGYKADPNYPGGSNVHDGGTYGTYLINDNGQLRPVSGLMIGGRVYEMTYGEAMALTQVIVHYVGNRGSAYNITAFNGYTYPSQTSEAFAHLKAYADSATSWYYNIGDVVSMYALYDNYMFTAPAQSISWYIYDYDKNQWVDYSGQYIEEANIDKNKKIQLKIIYNSKNLCNKLVNNTSTDNITVKHSYDPFVVSNIKGEVDYYDYISINNLGETPITVTYNKVESNKETIVNELIYNYQYNIDTFSQTAIVEINANDLINNGGKVNVSVDTGVGAAASPCYDASTGKGCARMFSCSDIQDCLLLASNSDTKTSSSHTVSIDVTGRIALKKVSERTDITEDNPCYDMSGAIYNVYQVSSNSDTNKGNKVGTFQVDEKGTGMVTYSKYNAQDTQGENGTNSVLTKLPIGWYMICEEEGPANGSYLLDTKKYYVNINADNYRNINSVVSEEAPMSDPIPFEIVKESSEGENLGEATLEGAQFTVWYYKGYYDSYEDIEAVKAVADRKWVFETKISKSTGKATCIIHKDLLVEGSDEPYLNNNGDMILPLGTIVVKETKAPKGYMLGGATYNLENTLDGTREPIEGAYVCKVYVDQGTVKLSLGNKVIVEEEPIRGDLKLVKKDKHTGKPMAGIAFLITSNTTGESHVIVTDEEGVASTEAGVILHSVNTNGNDAFEEDADLKPTGIWFGGEKTVVDDNKGALPYDSYTVKELYCKNNQEYYLSEEFQVNIDEPGQVVDCGEINNNHKPYIETEVFEMMGNDKMVMVGEKVNVIDKVYYQYLEVGKTYILKGTIVNKATGDKLMVEDELVEAVIEFVPTEENGLVEVPFELVIYGKAGDEWVVFECLYEKEANEIVASHEDINSPQQTFVLEEPDEPEEPKNPEMPDIPDIPDIPEEEVTTEVEAELASPGEPKLEPVVAGVSQVEPKTGDGTKLLAIIIIMAIAFVSVIGIVRKRIKE